MIIDSRPIEIHELSELIAFDQLHLQGAMKQLGIEEYKLAPPFTLDEVLIAYHRNDILRWIRVDDRVAGYLWRERRPGVLFGAGAAIQREYYGQGLSHGEGS